jgi:UDP-glucose:tetrahydrobiopterin glucosyltransferase
VGPLSTGLNGGVELTLRNAALALTRRHHTVSVIAPWHSRLEGVSLIEVPGVPQPSAQHQDRAAPVSMPADAVLANMWEAARRRQAEHDIVLNFAYDWLPLYLTPFFQVPVAHLVSMASLLDGMDSAIRHVVEHFPGSVAMHTRAQAETFGLQGRCRLIGNGLDLDLYPFQPAPEERLCWLGRIAPEKGVEDALAVAARTGIPLDVLGLIENADYWEHACRLHPDAPVTYHGFLDTPGLAAVLRRSRALLVTPKWTEAFGNVVMEALACGVPVIAYGRGGPAELIEDGRTGCLVPPDSIDDLVEAVARARHLDRRACRGQAERDFSLPALGKRLEDWLAELVRRA